MNLFGNYLIVDRNVNLDVIKINEKKAADIIMKARESWFN